MPPTQRLITAAAAVAMAGSLLAVPAVAQAAPASSSSEASESPHGIAHFQSERGLAPTGHLDGRTAEHLARASDAERRATFRTAADLDEEQMANARTVIGVGKGADIPEQGQVIALMTAMQESNFINYLEPVDHDSLGIFQQRPSMGWGTPEQITDVPTSSKSFYGVAPFGTNPGLLQIDGWETMPPGDAAQAVQRSAYPDRYAQWEQFARDLLAQEGPGVDPIP
nr:peptidoglycan-binding protein [Streptomyces sulphureus]